MFNQRIRILVFVFLLLSAFTSFAQAQDDVEPIRIGLYAPMTGPIAFLGEGFQYGATMAIEDLGGEIGGIPLELVVVDNKCNPTDAVNAVRQLIEVEEVDVILGGGCSSATVAAQPIIAEGGTPAVSATSTNPTIYDGMGVGGNIWQFRINPDDLIMAHAFSQQIAAEVQRISLVAENTDFGRGALAAYKPLFEELGVEIVTEDYFDLGTTDYRPALTRIRAARPEALLVVMTERDGSVFMRQLREVGIDVPIYSRGSLTSPLFLQFTEDDPTIGEGVIEFSFWAAGLDPEHDARFLERWGTPNSPHRGMSYYAVYYVIAEAIRTALEENGEVTREGIRDALDNLSIETPIGLIEFDDHNQAYPFGTLQTIRDGQTVFIGTIDLEPVPGRGQEAEAEADS
ncbi:ABC transporter substrate-binding protein [Anaerolineae bacterium CFX9]|nr:ABC transporter substrate-binding protein [Anaerolineae bacterium CFX9]